ncbi:MAG: DUF378 domain-containing protein [Patescibacteria group bacterium]
MKKPNAVDMIAFILLVVGGLNWGLVGFLDWDLVAAIFGDGSAIARVVYALVGLAAVYQLVRMPSMMKSGSAAAQS